MKPTQEQLNDPIWWDEHTPEGTTHVSISPTAAFPWLKDDGVNIFWSSGRNEWVKYTDREVREEHFSGAIPRPTEWRGPEDGLPPVGAIVEFTRELEDTYFPDDLKGGSSVEILCHYTPVKVKVAVFAYDTDRDGYEGKKVAQAKACCFRPIQSDREKSLAEMWQIMNDNADYGLGGMAGALYDAGWRKQMSRETARGLLRDTSTANSALEETRSSTPSDSRSNSCTG